MQLYGNFIPKKVKIIAFDFDETMYYSNNIKEFYIKYILKTVMTLTGRSEKESMELLDKYGFTSGGDKRIGFGKNCEKFGVTIHQWNDYRIKNFFQIDYANAKTVSNELYKELAKRYKLYIISNEVLENLHFKADKLSIDLSPFTKIYAPTTDNVLNYNSNKKEVFEKIREENNCLFEEIFAIGDRYAVDIEPLVELGGNGLLINRVDEIENFWKVNL